MKMLLGITIGITTVIGGYMLHHGNMMLLFVPTEYLIIGGCLAGAMIIQNPVRVLTGLAKGLLGQITGKGDPGSAEYLDLLKMCYELMQLARKEGVLALESHVNEPYESSIFENYPSFTSDHHAVAFLCDTLKLFVAGVLDPHNMDELMERDLEVMHHEEMQPSKAMSKAADALPAIGIVAAVLGIILTMSSIADGAEAVGMNIAAALVGTFLGVFMAYGFVGPMAGSLEVHAAAMGRYYGCIRYILTASISGVNPPMAVEIGRRSIYTSDRPSFEQLEEALRELKSGTPK